MQNSIETSPHEPLGLSFPGVQFTEAGLELPNNLPFEEWLHIGDTLQRLDRGIQWGLANWLLYGELHFPDRYTQALDASHYRGRQSLYNLSRVARQFPNVNSRYEGLSFSHHQELCNIEAPYRANLAERAIEEGLSTYELRMAIEHEKAVLGMIEPPYEVETADEFVEKWVYSVATGENNGGGYSNGVTNTIEALCNPTYEGSGRMLDIILQRRKAALAREKK